VGVHPAGVYVHAWTFDDDDDDDDDNDDGLTVATT